MKSCNLRGKCARVITSMLAWFVIVVENISLCKGCPCSLEKNKNSEPRRSTIRISKCKGKKGKKKISARTKISRGSRGSINSLIIGTREILQTLFHVRRDEKEINGRQLFRKKKSVLALNCNVRVHVTRYDDPLIISFFFFFFKLVPRAAVPFNFLRHAGLDTVNSTWELNYKLDEETKIVLDRIRDSYIVFSKKKKDYNYGRNIISR